MTVALRGWSRVATAVLLVGPAFGAPEDDRAAVPLASLARLEVEVERVDVSPEAPLVQRLSTLIAPQHLASRTLESVAAEIAALDPATVQAAFAYLDGTLPLPIPLGTKVYKGKVPKPDAVLFEALRRWPARAVSAHVRACVPADAPLATRLVAWRILAEVGREGGFGAWDAISSDVPAAHLASPAARTPCRAALIGILRRDNGAFAELSRRFDDLPRHLQALACDAVANSGRAAGERLLITRLPRAGHAPDEIQLAALDALARLVEGTTGDLLEEDLADVRALARHPDARVRAATLVLLGRVFDLRSHPLLTDALSDADDTVRAAAHWALRWIAVDDLGTEAGPWTAWFDAQLAWYEAELPRLHRAIEIRVPEQSIRAARTLAERPWFRHTSSREVATLCSAEDPNLVRQACVVLRELKSPAAVPFLLDALASAEEGSRDALRGTLVAITGRDLPADTAKWRAALLGG